MKIKIDLDDLAYFAFSDLTNKERMEIIKKLIHNAPDMHDFYHKVMGYLASDKFTNTLD